MFSITRFQSKDSGLHARIYRWWSDLMNKCRLMTLLVDDQPVAMQKVEYALFSFVEWHVLMRCDSVDIRWKPADLPGHSQEENVWKYVQNVCFTVQSGQKLCYYSWVFEWPKSRYIEQNAKTRLYIILSICFTYFVWFPMSRLNYFGITERTL